MSTVIGGKPECVVDCFNAELPTLTHLADASMQSDVHMKLKYNTSKDQERVTRVRA